MASVSTDVGDLEAFAAKLDQAGDVLVREAPKILGEVAKAIADDARELAPQGPTGDLKASVASHSEGLTAVVEAPIRYAIFVEYGTSKMAPQPFMTPALEAHEDELADKLEAAVEKALG